MTIGKNSRKSSVRSSIRAPKFLDKASGFYGRLDEPEAAGEGEEVIGKDMEDSSRERGVRRSQSPSEVHVSVADEMDKAEAFDASEGMMEDDGETLLSRKPSRHSRRWRRSSRRKQKEGRAEEDATRDERPSQGAETPVDLHVQVDEVETERVTEEEKEKAGGRKEATATQFAAWGDADDQVLIRDKKRGREEEGEEERKIKREQEEGMKMVKRNTVKNYRKALDRAFRRGWETFIANLYSVTLTPITPSPPPSSSPSLKKKQQDGLVLAEFR